jgi:hypothetical protein
VYDNTKLAVAKIVKSGKRLDSANLKPNGHGAPLAVEGRRTLNGRANPEVW